MNILKTLLLAAGAIVALCGTASCSDDTTYAEELEAETKYVNYFLANHRVINEVPADSVFEYGPDAPYYRLDEDGNLYMQVIEPGTPGNRAEYDELLYFRFTRYDLNTYYSTGELGEGMGNGAALATQHAFRFGNFTLQSSSQYGSGIQVPLTYLPIDCVVNIVIKSQYGFTEETSYVQPYLYNIRYYRPQV